jgi:hypothetical protein
MGRVLEVVAGILFVPAYLYGLYRAVMLFFEVQRCSGTECVWIFDGWNPLVWGILFAMYLPFTPLIAVVMALIYLIPSIVPWWIARRFERA